MFRFLILFSCLFSVSLAQCGNFTDNLCLDHPNCRWSDVLTCCLYGPVVSVPTGSPTGSPSVAFPSSSPTKLLTASPSTSPTPVTVPDVPDTNSNGGENSAIVIGLIVALFLLTFAICYYMKLKNRT